MYSRNRQCLLNAIRLRLIVINRFIPTVRVGRAVRGEMSLTVACHVLNRMYAVNLFV